MNPISTLSQQNPSMLFGLTVIAQITLITLVALVVILAVSSRKAALRHMIAVCALITVLASPLLTGIMHHYNVSLYSFKTEAPRENSPAELNTVPVIPQVMIEAPASLENESSPLISPLEIHPTQTRSFSWALPLTTGLYILWLIGMAAMMIRFIYGLGFQYACCRKGYEVDMGQYPAVIERIKTALKNKRALPPIICSGLIDHPLAVGLIHQRILLPASMFEQLDEDQLTDVLIHECSHIMHGDLWVGFGQRMAEIIFWPHPLLHLLNRILARSREEICDNHVLKVRPPHRYAQTLLDLTAVNTTECRMPGTAGLMGLNWKLEDRVRGLLDEKRNIMTENRKGNKGLVFTTFLTGSLLIASLTVQAVPTSSSQGAEKQLNEESPIKAGLKNAIKLRDEGNYEEALQQHLSLYETTKEFVGMGMMKNVLKEWMKLSELYPSAKEALLAIRESSRLALLNGYGTQSEFWDFRSINEILNENQKTLEMFLFLHENYPDIAKSAYFFAYDLLIKEPNYQLIGFYINDGIMSYEQIRLSREDALRRMKTTPDIKDSLIDIDNRFIKQIRELIDILIANGRDVEAIEVQKRALSYFEHDEIESVLTDAQKKIASLPPQPVPEHSNPATEKNDALPPSTDQKKLQPLLSASKSSNEVGWPELKEARRLRDEGHYEEALRQHLYFHESSKTSNGMTGVRRSYALKDWMKLAEQYPLAKEALIAIRDSDRLTLMSGHGESSNFADFESINDVLKEEDKTVELFLFLHENNPKIARKCIFYIEDLLIEKQAYQVYSTYIEDAVQRYELSRSGREAMLSYTRRNTDDDSEKIRASADRRFIKKTRQLIEVLIATGRDAEAQEVQQRALKYFEHDEIKSALTDAQDKLAAQKMD